MLSLRYKSLSKNYFKFLVFLVLSITTSSCSNIISATRDTPINENYGKRTAGAAIDDQWIETKAKVNLKKLISVSRKLRYQLKVSMG